MKKVSTTAVKAMKNFSQPKLTIGLDLDDRLGDLPLPEIPSSRLEDGALIYSLRLSSILSKLLVI
jgi:hypothetical protein